MAQLVATTITTRRIMMRRSVQARRRLLALWAPAVMQTMQNLERKIKKRGSMQEVMASRKNRQRRRKKMRVGPCT